MKLASTPHERTIDVDISSDAFWAKSFEERDESFARLRREAPVSWHPPTEFPFPHEEAGFWAVVKNDDINTVSRQTQRFGSRFGVSLDPFPFDLARSLSFFLTLDAPEHARYRELVSSAFTRRQVALIDEQIRSAAREIVDDLVGAGDVDFVEHCASRLPMRTIADMMGVPESERVAAARAGDAVIGRSDPSFGDPADPIGTITDARDHLYALGAELAQHRRAHPGDDLLTNLVNAEVDGQRLTDDDIGAFMVLFTVAGNDTTRNTTSLTAVAFDRNPDQRAYLLEDFDGRIMPAVEEFVRHGSPVMQFTRTALVDTELGGQQIAAGRQGVRLLLLGEPRRGGVRPTAGLRSVTAEEPARRLRRWRPALLHRRRVGEVAAARPDGRAADPRPGHGGRRARVRRRELHPRRHRAARARALR